MSDFDNEDTEPTRRDSQKWHAIDNIVSNIIIGVIILVLIAACNATSISTIIHGS